MSLFGMLSAMMMGAAPGVARTAIKGYIVSTVDSYDMGMETAILHQGGSVPVERYPSREAALDGHARWINFCRSRRSKLVTELGYGTLVKDKKVRLKPFRRTDPKWGELLANAKTEMAE